MERSVCTAATVRIVNRRNIGMGCAPVERVVGTSSLLNNPAVLSGGSYQRRSFLPDGDRWAVVRRKPVTLRRPKRACVCDVHRSDQRRINATCRTLQSPLVDSDIRDSSNLSVRGNLYKAFEGSKKLATGPWPSYWIPGWRGCSLGWVRRCGHVSETPTRIATKQGGGSNGTHLQ